MAWKDIVSTRTIEELEAEIYKAQSVPKMIDLDTFFSGLAKMSIVYGQRIYDNIEAADFPRDEIEGSGTAPGFGHIIWATALITSAWIAWLFPDKGLRRFNERISEEYLNLVKASITYAVETGAGYVGQDRTPLTG